MTGPPSAFRILASNRVAQRILASNRLPDRGGNSAVGTHHGDHLAVLDDGQRLGCLQRHALTATLTRKLDSRLHRRVVIARVEAGSVQRGTVLTDEPGQRHPGGIGDVLQVLVVGFVPTVLPAADTAAAGVDLKGHSAYVPAV